MKTKQSLFAATLFGGRPLPRTLQTYVVTGRVSLFTDRHGFRRCEPSFVIYLENVHSLHIDHSRGPLAVRSTPHWREIDFLPAARGNVHFERKRNVSVENNLNTRMHFLLKSIYASHDRS